MFQLSVDVSRLKDSNTILREEGEKQWKQLNMLAGKVSFFSKTSTTIKMVALPESCDILEN